MRLLDSEGLGRQNRQVSRYRGRLTEAEFGRNHNGPGKTLTRVTTDWANRMDTHHTYKGSEEAPRKVDTELTLEGNGQLPQEGQVKLRRTQRHQRKARTALVRLGCAHTERRLETHTRVSDCVFTHTLAQCWFRDTTGTCQS